MTVKVPPLSPTAELRCQLRLAASRAFVDIYTTARRAQADWPTFQYYVAGGW